MDVPLYILVILQRNTVDPLLQVLGDLTKVDRMRVAYGVNTLAADLSWLHQRLARGQRPERVGMVIYLAEDETFAPDVGVWQAALQGWAVPNLLLCLEGGGCHELATQLTLGSTANNWLLLTSTALNPQTAWQEADPMHHSALLTVLAAQFGMADQTHDGRAWCDAVQRLANEAASLVQVQAGGQNFAFAMLAPVVSEGHTLRDLLRWLRHHFESAQTTPDFPKTGDDKAVNLTVQQRRLDAATPRTVVFGQASEVRTMLALPTSLGLKKYLPVVIESGAEIKQGDVQANDAGIEFPKSADGSLLPRYIYLQLRAARPADFEVPQPRVTLKLYPDRDSGVHVFYLTPLCANPAARLAVELYDDAAYQVLLGSTQLIFEVLAPSSTPDNVAPEMASHPKAVFDLGVTLAGAATAASTVYVINNSVVVTGYNSGNIVNQPVTATGGV